VTLLLLMLQAGMPWGLLLLLLLVLLLLLLWGILMQQTLGCSTPRRRGPRDEPLLQHGRIIGSLLLPHLAALMLQLLIARRLPT
jgi:hypothetical protein